MNLHEYQSKQVFAKYGLPVSSGYACFNQEEALAAFDKLNQRAVIKCQVHAGGRGKAGGVKLVDTKEQVIEFCQKWFGNRLVTFQTDAKGQPVNCIYLEPTTDIEKELYLGALIDRSSQKIVFMASSEGGMSIEDVAEKTPELIFKAEISPELGAQAYQGRDIAFKLGLKGAQVNQFAQIFVNLGRMFEECDVDLVEINPLIIKTDGNLLCLDAKVSIDSNALYRQKELKVFEDESQDEPREAKARSLDLSYVSLDGNIGCMVNGAGLAMGTMDIVKHYGGNPANFLDVGGGADQKRVANAFKLILDDESVKVVLINIFGGIIRCDLIAEGVIEAMKEVDVKVPVVVRLEGNNADKGLKLLEECPLDIISAKTLQQAAQEVVRLAAGE